MADGAIPVVRGCGERIAGGVYWETGLSRNGVPLETLLIDPPSKIPSLTDLGMSEVGVTILEREGTFHVFDWVGSKHYRNVADIIEEGRRFGFSRRIPVSADFTKLTPKSRLILLHRRAFIENWQAYRGWDAAHGELHYSRACPKSMAPHDLSTPTEGIETTAAINPHTFPTLFRPIGQMCCGLWWDDISDGVTLEAAGSDRTVTRSMPSFSYVGRTTPDAITPAYSAAAFISLPLTRLVVVKDDSGGTHETAMARLQQQGQDPTLVDA